MLSEVNVLLISVKFLVYLKPIKFSLPFSVIKCTYFSILLFLIETFPKLSCGIVKVGYTSKTLLNSWMILNLLDLDCYNVLIFRGCSSGVNKYGQKPYFL
jgi:hypothetical protein